MKKIAADLIATEMFRLLKKASENDAKEVSVNVAGKANVKENDAKSHSMHMTDDEEDHSEDNLEDYLMDSEDDSDDDVSYIDDEINDMKKMSDDSEDEDEDHAEDNLMREHGSEAQADYFGAQASDMRLMNGLGKIEASLRRKGEGFAADLVRSTALSIQEDIVKEASKKTQVRSTIMKINR
jgi:hypothetical protein